MRFSKAWWLVSLSLLLAGCGGSGSGGSNTPPTVTATSPASGTTGVSISSTLTATFSEAMNASTLTTSTFTLTGPGGTAVTGSVSYSSANSTATFTPSAPLAYSTSYTATVTTGAQSSSGTALTSNDTWSFTTGAAPGPTVNAVTPASGATNVSANTAVTATFSEAMNASTITTTTFTLTPQGGSAVAATVSYSATDNIATLTPSAPLANNTTYTATITTGAQSSGGMALASNYAWSFTTAAAPAPSIVSVSPSNTATGVSANSTVTATFSEAMNASTLTTSTFTLTGPGNTTVAGIVSYNASTFTATFTPSAALAYNTSYTAAISTGVTAAGGPALAQGESWSFTTGGPPAPTITAVTPANNSTGVAVTATATATFSEAMTASTLTGSTFTLAPLGGSAVAATVSYSSSGDIATLTPSAPLAYNTTYTATITTGVQSSQGTALAANYTWSFTTAIAPPPTITAVTPTNASTGVAVSTAVTATFSQAMTASTLTTSTFTLTGTGNTAVAGTVSYNAGSSAATFTPSQNLSYNTAYTATVTTGVQNYAGVALGQNYTWSFTTTTPPVPAVSSTVPASGATNVNAANALTATFNQPMNASTLTTSTFTLATTTGNTAVTGMVSYTAGSQTATFTPGATLAYSTSYTATITTGAQSSAGAALASNYTWGFTTGAAPAGVAVDFGTTYQTIQGFGGSTAWLGAMPQAVATALFSPTKGLGLSILRVRIDPTGSATGGGQFGDPYETGEWDYELTNGQEATANNPNAVVFATPWTPPATWKLNGSATFTDPGSSTTYDEAFYDNEAAGSCSPALGYCGGYLNPSDYAAYASYLEDFVNFFDSNAGNGIKLYAISMQNEPEENVSYESCVWSPDQMDTWVASLTAGGATNPITTKLIMPEADSFQFSQSNPTLNDANAVGNVSIVGGHIYGVNPSYYTLAESLGKPVWMTEFGPLSEAQLTFAEALNPYAIDIHNSMVTGQYNAFVWWGLFGQSTGSCATAAGTCGLVDNAGTLQAPGEVMGQFSKFIQPGYVRVSATATPVSGVYVSAYTNSSPAHYVIVAINSNSSVENIDFTLDLNGNPTSSVTSLTPYESTASLQLAPQTAVPVSSGQFTFALPATSIVTFVQ